VILDSSALVAVMLREPGSDSLMRRMAAAHGTLAIGSASLVEAGIVLSARLGEDARGRIARVLDEVQIQFCRSRSRITPLPWMPGCALGKAGISQR